jgi:hypothetical protein
MSTRASGLALALTVLCLSLPLYSQGTAPPQNPAPNAGAAPSPAPATGPTSAAATTQAQKASDAANQVEKFVATAADALNKAQTYQKSINDISGPAKKSGQSALDNIQNLQTIVQSIQTGNVLNDLSTSLSNLDTKSAAMSALSKECDKGTLQQPATPQQDVTNAQTACATAQKDAADKLTALPSAQSGLLKALQSISPYMASQFDALADTLKTFSDKKLIPAPGANVAPVTPAPAKDAPAAPAASGTSVSTAPDPGVLLQVLPKGLPALKNVLDSIQQYSSAWGSMKAMVQSANDAIAKSAATASAANAANAGGAAKDPAADAAKTPAPKDADTEMTQLQATTANIEKGLASWFAAITGALTTDAHALDGKIADVQTDPAKNNADALGQVRDKTDTLNAAQSVVDAWPPLVGYLVDGQPDGFSLSTTRKNLEDMQTWTNQLRASISRVHDALAGDFENAEADQVSLYYFTDIPRLMQVLNEGVQTIGGVSDAQAKAAAQRTALTQAELDLGDAQATVNRYQKQVLDLQEQQRQAQEKLKGLNAKVSSLASRLKGAQDSQQTATDEYNNALGAQKSSSANSTSGQTDPTTASTVASAKAEQTAATTKTSQAQSDYDAAKTERDNTQSQLDDTQNQKDSLPAKLAAAQQALSDAQTSVSAERRKMLMAAQAESDAFAFARDNTPFLYAPADASSHDPAKRVVLFAFNDSKTIFMRGNPKDLALVKNIIANFDRPAPQARLTLWTFELNADSGQKTNKKAAENLNKSMEIVDEELSGTRALENTTLSLLRDYINQGVRKCFKNAALYAGADGETRRKERVAALDEAAQKLCARQSGSTECADARTTAREFAVTPWQCALPPTPDECTECNAADFEKLRRITFYDPLVLEQLGFVAEANGEIPLKLLRELVPDPAGTTTLGEALMILSLAPLDTRLAIRDQVESAIHERLGALPLPEKLDKSAWFRSESENQTSSKYLLPLTWHALDIWEHGTTGSGIGLTGSQLEIARALQTAYQGKQIRQFLDGLGSRSADLRSVRVRIDAVQDTLTSLEDRGKELLAKSSPSDATALTQLQQLGSTALEADAAKRDALVQKAISLLPAADRNAYTRETDHLLKLQAGGETFGSRFTPDPEWGINPSDFNYFIAKLGAATSDADFSDALTDLKILAYRSPSLSSASPRVAAADEMLKEITIALEDDLDRLFVQPMISGLRIRLASETGVRVGILQRESMLASNRGKARVDPKASAQLAVGQEEDILAGVQQLAQLYATVQSGGALAALGALQQQPREPQPEIYALTTGNKFEVTPVFDPSGQALRFKFDFVSTSNLQEPNGTTNPQMPRVERHTVNTEVQLSNLETREISRFESNARLGLPTTYWGGIPILKDIPGVRPWVPLLGWFVRKGGSNASAQQSVIFGQTTMYPTIGAIIDLLSDTSQSDTSQGTKPDGLNKNDSAPPSPDTPTPQPPTSIPPKGH